VFLSFWGETGGSGVYMLSLRAYGFANSIALLIVNATIRREFVRTTWVENRGRSGQSA
jgi:hypothetical protein